jgi:hypothetical protein
MDYTRCRLLVQCPSCGRLEHTEIRIHVAMPRAGSLCSTVRADPVAHECQESR